jgi:hypothetical protein
MKNSTHIAMVLDRSGSMETIATDTVGGLNRFIKEQQAVPGDCTLIITHFDTNAIDTLRAIAPIKDIALINAAEFQPRGGTPLWDAIGKTIATTGDYLKSLPDAQRPDKIIFVVMTDGLENSSRDYTHPQVRDMIQHQTDVYKWQFVFLGANINSYAVGGAIGVAAVNTMNYASNSAGVQAAYASTSANTRSFRTGQSVCMSFSDEDREAQEKAGADQFGAPKAKSKSKIKGQ